VESEGQSAKKAEREKAEREKAKREKAEHASPSAFRQLTVGKKTVPMFGCFGKTDFA
jgi:hypothetical protein